MRRYLPAVNPVIDVQMAPSGLLTFKNAAVEADVAKVPDEYIVRWMQFDNQTGGTTPLGETRTPGTTTVAAPARGGMEWQSSRRTSPKWQRKRSSASLKAR